MDTLNNGSGTVLKQPKTRRFLKMKLRQIASNMTEVEFGPTTILFSYSTPVAGFHPVHGPNETGHFKTSQWYSQTTTRHVNKYFRDEWGIDASSVRTIPQERINEMAK